MCFSFRKASFHKIRSTSNLDKTIQQDFSASKLAELLTWPEDLKVTLLEERKYTANYGEFTVYEMTCDQWREVKKMLNERKEQSVIDATPGQLKPARVRVDFSDKNDPFYQTLKKRAQDQGMKPDQIIRAALEQYLRT